MNECFFERRKRELMNEISRLEDVERRLRNTRPQPDEELFRTSKKLFDKCEELFKLKILGGEIETIEPEDEE